MYWFINLSLYKKVDISFSAHKLTKYSSNPGKANFEGLVNNLRHIRYNKTLVLKYYADIKDAPLSDLLIQDSIKTDNQLMVYLILSSKIFQTLEEVQEHILSFIKVYQLTMAYMFQLL